MRVVAALITPIAAILVVNGVAVSVLLFGYGAATPQQAGLMGLIVSVFMTGLLPFTLFYVLLRGFYAMEDTRTPFWVTVGFSIVFLGLAYPLFALAPRAGGTQVAALALAYSLSYWVGLIAAWWILARRLGSLESGRTAWVLVRLIIAALLSIVAMLVVVGTVITLDPATMGSNTLRLIASLVLSSIVGVAVFALAAWAMRVPELRDVLSLVRRTGARLGRRGSRP
jgi:putative peptidoglycan lipid II flippase